MKPKKDYVLYAYGVEFDMENPEKPVRVVTPMVKRFFTTPEWEATSNTTFELSIEGQEIIGNGDDAIVNVNLKVTPSSEKEKYYIAFMGKDMLNENSTVYDFAFDAIYSEEVYGGVTDWSVSELLSSGEKILASKDFEWGIYPGKEYMALVFGVDGNGLVTTAIASLDFTSMGTTTGSADSHSRFSLKRVVSSPEERK